MKRSLITLILGLSFATSWALAQDPPETSDSDVTQTVKQSDEASETLAPPTRNDEDLATETEAEENKNRGRRRSRSISRSKQRQAAQRGRRAEILFEFKKRDGDDGPFVLLRN